MIPLLTRGRLVCSSSSSTSTVTCKTVCDTGYTVNPDRGVSPITCTDGKWVPQIPYGFERLQCISKLSCDVQVKPFEVLKFAVSVLSYFTLPYGKGMCRLALRSPVCSMTRINHYVTRTSWTLVSKLKKRALKLLS